MTSPSTFGNRPWVRSTREPKGTVVCAPACPKTATSSSVKAIQRVLLSLIPLLLHECGPLRPTRTRGRAWPNDARTVTSLRATIRCTLGGRQHGGSGHDVLKNERSSENERGTGPGGPVPRG